MKVLLLSVCVGLLSTANVGWAQGVPPVNVPPIYQPPVVQPTRPPSAPINAPPIQQPPIGNPGGPIRR